ncbi:MAG: type II toxin-antitoxin system HipA family toxin [bacterium]|nr:type II toxin-antitoxin system HipA family toxin [bacterium]
MITTAFIYLWDQRAGAIAWNEDTGMASFEFDKNFKNHHWDLAPFEMPIDSSEGTIFSFPELRASHTFNGLPGLIADVLPDKYGNAIIDAWLIKNGRPSGSLNPVEKLCFIGNRGMGALEFKPVQPETKEVSNKIEIASLVTVAEQILSGKKDFSSRLNSHDEKNLHDILKIGTSAGGARAKAVIAYNEKTKEVRSGQTNVPKGFTQWLIKFDGVSDQQLGSSSGYGRVEMAYHLMAKAAGIEMMPCRLFEENGRAHFMTQRFDRLPNNEKVHVQSFCAMRHFDFNEVHLYSYEQLFETMRLLGLPYPSAAELFKRMVFNVMARNCDDHTKNFSFTMHKDGVWQLAPAFDICHAYRPGSTWVSQHALSINGKRQTITTKDFMEVAYQMNIKKPKEIIEEVKVAVSDWKKYAKMVEVDAKLSKAIEQTLLPNI